MEHILDFSGKRVRRDGKSMSKFEVASVIDALNPFLCATIIMDALSYVELSSLLQRILQSKNYRGIYGETYSVIGL